MIIDLHRLSVSSFLERGNLNLGCVENKIYERSRPFVTADSQRRPKNSGRTSAVYAVRPKLMFVYI